MVLTVEKWNPELISKICVFQPKLIRYVIIRYKYVSNSEGENSPDTLVRLNIVFNKGRLQSSYHKYIQRIKGTSV